MAARQGHRSIHSMDIPKEVLDDFYERRKRMLQGDGKEPNDMKNDDVVSRSLQLRKAAAASVAAAAAAGGPGETKRHTVKSTTPTPRRKQSPTHSSSRSRSVSPPLRKESLSHGYEFEDDRRAKSSLSGSIESRSISKTGSGSGKSAHSINGGIKDGTNVKTVNKKRGKKDSVDTKKKKTYDDRKPVKEKERAKDSRKLEHTTGDEISGVMDILPPTRASSTKADIYWRASKSNGTPERRRPATLYVTDNKPFRKNGVHCPHQVSFVACCGDRDHQEDRFIASIARDPLNVCVFAICDGHGGPQVSSELERRLAPFILDSLRFYFKEPKPIISVDKWIYDVRLLLEKTMVNLDRKLYSEYGKDWDDVGSTVTMCVNIGVHFFLVNVGDSRSVLFDDDGNIILATKDHKPDAERERVESGGGMVTQSSHGGVPRVNSSLAISRTIGDFNLKRKAYQRTYGGVVQSIPRYNAIDAPVIAKAEVLHWVADQLSVPPSTIPFGYWPEGPRLPIQPSNNIVPSMSPPPHVPMPHESDILPTTMVIVTDPYTGQPRQIPRGHVAPNQPWWRVPILTSPMTGVISPSLGMHATPAVLGSGPGGQPGMPSSIPPIHSPYTGMPAAPTGIIPPPTPTASTMIPIASTMMIPPRPRKYYLLIGSDGLWDADDDSKKPIARAAEYIKSVGTLEASRKLVKRALERYSHDNISILLIELFSESIPRSHHKEAHSRSRDQSTSK